MAPSISKPPTLAAFFCISLLLFSATEVERAEAEAVCGRPSGTFRGPCFSSGQCRDQCRLNEGAIGGSCFILACYCTFDCNNP